MGKILKQNFPTSEITCEGIEGISLDMVKEAKAEGKRWKLISQLLMEEGQIKSVSVKPMKLDDKESLANVGGALNALCFKTDMLGPDLTMIGPGAGKIETGFSLFSDLMYLCDAYTHEP